MNILSIRITNAPALIKCKKISFFIRENNVDKVLFEHPEYKNELAYPIENNQITIETGIEVISHIKAVECSPKKLIRKVHIDYTWISDNKETYFFELESEYDIISKGWKSIKEFAN